MRILRRPSEPRQSIPGIPYIDMDLGYIATDIHSGQRMAGFVVGSSYKVGTVSAHSEQSLGQWRSLSYYAEFAIHPKPT